jgi:hypothetical protein
VTKGGEWVPNEQLAIGLGSPLEGGTRRSMTIQLLEYSLIVFSIININETNLGITLAREDYLTG